QNSTLLFKETPRRAVALASVQFSAHSNCSACAAVRLLAEQHRTPQRACLRHLVWLIIVVFGSFDRVTRQLIEVSEYLSVRLERRFRVPRAFQSRMRFTKRSDSGFRDCTFSSRFRIDPKMLRRSLFLGHP